MSAKRSNAFLSSSSEEAKEEKKKRRYGPNSFSSSDEEQDNIEKRKSELIILLNKHITNVAVWHILDDYKRLYDQWKKDAQITHDNKDKIITTLWNDLNHNRTLFRSMRQPKENPFRN